MSFAVQAKDVVQTLESCRRHGARHHQSNFFYFGKSEENILLKVTTSFTRCFSQMSFSAGDIWVEISIHFYKKKQHLKKSGTNRLCSE